VGAVFDARVRVHACQRQTPSPNHQRPSIVISSGFQRL
jgi:hypothetical protein